MFCKKTIWIALSSAVVFGSAFGQLSVTPALPERVWTHEMWLPRFDAKRALAAQGGYDIVFLGDSITHGWETRGAEVWAKNFAEGPYKALNCGFSGDRTEHVLWRLDHGQLADLKPRAFVLMIGTNNTGHRDVETEPPTDTILGIQAILGRLEQSYPEAKVILHPIFPRGATTNDPLRVRNDLVNREIRTFTDGKRVLWCDFNSRLLTTNGVLETSMAKDLLHPGATGYEIWAEALKPYLDYALGRSPKAPKSAAAPAPTALPNQAAAPTGAAPQATLDPASIPALRSPGEILVWHTSNGKWYHSRSSCGSMTNASQYTLASSVNAGLTACPYCNPIGRSVLGVENAVYADGGKKWHIDFACQAITGGWTISPLDEARANEALTPCEACGAIYYAGGMPQATPASADGSITNAGTLVYTSERNGYYHANNTCPNAAGITLQPAYLTDALRAGKQRCPSCNPPEPVPAE